ncbi:ABC transporter substrate-binding protein [Cellulomonas endophytica]|uniref:ABC transporter substrate-binding protein n=1 Tax=Cellulomonas endophytica TaxID=2494735 RepID=UPI001011D164|nr:extracellular solute-binding protein [Cellulomonas endophytica]
MRTTKLVAVATAALTCVALAACSSGSGDEAADGDGPITLDYWAWGTSQPGLVEAWNAANPDVQVRHTDAGGGTDSSAKLLTATRADEAPDVAVVEYNTLPAMIVGDVAADITEQVDEETKGAFTDAVWGLTTFNDAIYGIPQDVGPMALVYNEARLAELGVAVPTTWAEFADAAAAVRAADPDTYLATFAPGEFGFFSGMAQQAGAEWWSVDGETWTVGIDDEPSRAVADYWQDLVDRDLVKVESLLTPEWNAQLNAGNILSWPSALWAPGVIYGVAPDMAGQWALAKLPQWEAGDDRVAFQGGSAVVVTTSSEHPAEAARFAAWINSSEEGAAIQIETGQYPASLTGQELATQSEPPVLMPQQTDFWTLAAEIAGSTLPDISWGPNVNVASSAFQDAMQAAADSGTPFRDALATTQETVVEDMTTTGFDVQE